MTRTINAAVRMRDADRRPAGLLACRHGGEGARAGRLRRRRWPRRAPTSRRRLTRAARASQPMSRCRPSWPTTTQLVQLFQNLIGNALKFRAERRPPAHPCRCRARRGPPWLSRSRTTASGSSRSTFDRIFKLGERLHGVAKYPGNGIGLATCEKIVQRHGGRIWAESAGPGRGSTFTFTLSAVDDGPRPARRQRRLDHRKDLRVLRPHPDRESSGHSRHPLRRRELDDR